MGMMIHRHKPIVVEKPANTKVVDEKTEKVVKPTKTKK